MASAGIQSLLALEVPVQRRPAGDPQRDPREAAADGTAHRVRLPTGGLLGFRDRGAVAPAQQFDQEGLLGSSPRLRPMRPALRLRTRSPPLCARPRLVRRSLGGSGPLLRNLIHLDADRGATGIGDDECQPLAALRLAPHRGIVPGRLLIKQTLLQKAFQNLANGGARELDRPPLTPGFPRTRYTKRWFRTRATTLLPPKEPRTAKIGPGKRSPDYPFKGHL
jgi:hypothetical protein